MRSDIKLRAMKNHNVTSSSLGEMLLATFSHFPMLRSTTATNEGSSQGPPWSQLHVTMWCWVLSNDHWHHETTLESKLQNWFFSLPLSPLNYSKERKRKKKTILRQNTQLTLKIKHNKLNIDLTTVTIPVCLHIYPSIILPSPLRRQSDAENEAFFLPILLVKLNLITLEFLIGGKKEQNAEEFSLVALPLLHFQGSWRSKCALVIIATDHPGG